VSQVVKESASGVHDSRPKRLALREDRASTRMVVEHQDRLTRLGCRSVATVLRGQSRAVDVVPEAGPEAGPETEDLMADLTAMRSSFPAPLYGHRRAKRTTETVIRA
jgi:predicted site-specific integrase-resolvase